MGFMNKLNKMKNFLFDEEEIEEKPTKKHFKKSKEKSSKNIDNDFDKTQEIENLYLEDLSDSEPIVNQELKSRVVKNETEFKFPEFNDDDFSVSKEKVEPIIPVKTEEVKPVLYQGSKRKEETKKFKPSPIISPVYGLLDEEGNKIKKDEPKTDNVKKSKDEITFDEVRKKAYGKVDEEIENTLKKLSKKTIGEAEKEMELENNVELSRTKEKAKKNIKEESKRKLVSDDSDDMLLPNVNFKEIDVDKECIESSKSNQIKKELPSIDEDDDEETKEQDLFNLIDTMYQDKEDN